MKGLIYDIQKCALNDGPGIRTVVFFKGCPLSCHWCCNPESQITRLQLSFKADRCQCCGACVAVCQNSVHSISNNEHIINFEPCGGCGACVNHCPYNALKLIGYQAEPEEIIDLVEKDRNYYINSGGGLTLSGGEPLMQFDFARELLLKARERAINTCIESSGYIDTERFQSIVPLVDHFLFDYKLSDPQLHKVMTGVSNELILKNLAILDKMNADIIVRCPIITDVNDSESHFQHIAALSHRYKNIRCVEIMPYHDMGRQKATEIGSAYSMTQKSVADKTSDNWIKRLKQMNCRNIKKA